jgi:hypothetical protein
MGLNITKTNSSGFSVAYWRVGTVQMGPDGSAVVTVYAYLNYAARVAGKEPALTQRFNWDAGDATNPLLYANWTAGKNIWQILYARAKQSAFFNGAVDVLEAGQTT